MDAEEDFPQKDSDVIGYDTVIGGDEENQQNYHYLNFKIPRRWLSSWLWHFTC